MLRIVSSTRILAIRGLLGVVATAAMVLTCVVPPSEAASLRRWSFSPREGERWGGEVLLIRVPQAERIVAVRFGEILSPAIAIVPGEGLSVLVPPVELEQSKKSKRVRLRVELDDGRIRSLGRFLYLGDDVYRGRHYETWNEFGYGDDSGPEPVYHGVVRFTTSVTRIDKEHARYAYEVANLTDDVLRVNWRTLEVVGLPGGWDLSLPPRTTARYEAIGDVVATTAGGGATIDSPWIQYFGGLAFVPASAVPEPLPVENLTATDQPDGGILLAWTHPDPSSLDPQDGLEVYTTDATGQYWWASVFPRDSTSALIPAERVGSGVNGITVSAYRYGIPSRAILAVTR